MNNPSANPSVRCRCRFLALVVFAASIAFFGDGFVAADTGTSAAADEATDISSRSTWFLTHDWLLDAAAAKAIVSASDDELVLTNGLVRRVIRLKPNAATIALDNLMTGASMLRAVEPEATVTLGGKQYAVGGLIGQPDRAYLSPGWTSLLKADPKSFQLVSHRIGKPIAPFAWKRKRHAANLPWPPPGVAVDLVFRGPDESTRGITVTVHYELYDGLPVIGKWISIANAQDRPIRLDRFESDRLAAVEGESAVDDRPESVWRVPDVDVLSDYMFKGMDAATSNRVAVWEADPAYPTQVHYNKLTPCLLVVRPPVGPGLEIEPGGTTTSFRSYLVIHDSTERERKGLTLRRAMRGLAPWITENPLMMHVRSADSRVFRAAVDQCAAVGFEMIIYTFGSGLDMENEDPAYIAKVREDVDYAHVKGIEVGGYSLFSSRRIDDDNDVINPATGKTGGAIFGQAPCFGSQWGQNYHRKIKAFIAGTGLDLLEHDGPYPGDVCASTKHPGHRGMDDSQWVNWRMSADLYSWCRERGVYVNQPDFYFLAGGSKTGMGYRESNWSLPREQQLIHARQHIFDGTWTKPQTSGWMFVPLTEYHGGGPAATLEPLGEHLPDFEAHLANTLGAGVQACWRGPRLYDSDETRALVKRWVDWFKKYRDILESDVIHARRADGRDVDYMVLVNPRLSMRALAMIHNPLDVAAERDVVLPLYYAGLEGIASVREQQGPPRRIELDSRQRAVVHVKIPPHGRTWLVVEAAIDKPHANPTKPPH
ncbi:MAG: hypothetical protein WD875_02940 [Pirellulales bacterium]